MHPDGNSEFGAWPTTIHFAISAFSEYSCMLDKRLSDESDSQREKQLFDELLEPFLLQTPKYSSLYTLIEVAAATNTTFGGNFSAFIDKIFYVGWTEGIVARRYQHKSDSRQVCWLAPFKFSISYFSRRQNSEKWAPFGRRAAASS